MERPAAHDELQRRVQGFLDTTGLDYEVMPCDPDLADTALFCEHYGIPLERSANTILVASKRPRGRYALCVVLATGRLDVNRAVCRELDVKKASFASADETVEVTGMMIGGVTPLAIPADLPILVDAAVMEPDWIVLGGGDRSSKIRISPGIFRRIEPARVVDGLAVAVQP